MAPSFIFEAPIDEEPELSESKDEDNEEAGEEEKGDEAENKPSNPNANLNPHGISLLTPNPSQKNTLDVAPPPSISKYPKSSSKTPLQLRACETLGYTKPTLIQVPVGHPIDTVKGTLQKHNTEVQGIKYRNGLHCAARILATEGGGVQSNGPQPQSNNSFCCFWWSYYQFCSMSIRASERCRFKVLTHWFPSPVAIVVLLTAQLKP